jgi:membrane associated rhomboid family serine protease
MFNAPWPALALAVVIVLAYLVQIQFPDQEGLEARFGLVPSQLAAGDLIGLIGHIFLHGGWAHVLGNAVWIFVAATPLARLMGETAPRALALFAFFLICGVAAGALYAGVFELARHGAVPFYHPSQEVVLVGASGAASGLLGAAARTIGQGGRLGPLTTGPVIGLAIFFTLSNLMVGVLGFAPGVGPGVLVAWPVHIFGFFVGLFLIGPWVALFGRRPAVELSDGWPVPMNEL